MNAQFIMAFIVPAIFIGVGLIFYFKTKKFLSEGVRTSGVVEDYVSYSTIRDGRKRTYYKPVIKYVKDNGQEVTFTSEIGSNKKRMKIGEELEVIYHPRKAIQKINSFKYLFLFPTIFIGLGLVVFLIGFYVSMR